MVLKKMKTSFSDTDQLSDARILAPLLEQLNAQVLMA